MNGSRWIDSLLARVRAIVRGRRVEQDLQDELSFHEAMQTRANLQDGMNAEEARRRARLEMRGVEQAKEQCREARPLSWGHDLMRDIQYSFRSLLRSPGFTAIAVMTVALGVGANTAIFSVLNTYLLRPMPYKNPERLVSVFRTSIHSQTWPHSVANFLDYRQRNTVFEQMFAVNWVQPSLTQPGELAERLQAMTVSADFFPGLGVPAALGRWFAPEEDQPGKHRVAVLSDRFWQTRFGADPNILGRTLTIDGESVEIIGVMPPSFENSLFWNVPVDLWRPIAFTPQQRQDRGNNFLRAFGRLKPGVSRAQAEASMVRLAADLTRETSVNQGESLRLDPLQVVGSSDATRNVMWLTFGLAGFVLLIACANLANLQLVRTTARSREHAVRSALGAGRFRLLRQSLTESLMVAGLGGVLSVAFAIVGVQLISRQLFTDLPGARVALDVNVLGFALLSSILTGVVFGIIPAWLASRPDLNRGLKEQSRGATTNAHHRARHALIIGEVAFAVVLLSGAGLLLRGIERFAGRDPGWQVDGLLTAQLNLQGPAYATPAQRLNFDNRLTERLRLLPNVRAVALSSSPPPVWGFNSSTGVMVEGRPQPAPGQYPESFFEQVSLDYFKTLGLRLIAGRDFTSADVNGQPQVVIINNAMARRFWPNQNPIGQRMSRQGTQPVWLEVVGIVDDVQFPGSLAEPYTHLQAFRPLAQVAVPNMNLTLRTSSNPETLADLARRAVAELDPAMPLSRVRSVRSLVDLGMGNTSLLGDLLAAFAALGLLLAGIGVYGVTSYSVAQRTGEIGIRMALGARTGDVMRLVLSGGVMLVVCGALLGTVGAYIVSRVLIAAIPTLPTWDPVVVIGVTLAAILVALTACCLPARRAAGVSPTVALRHH